MKFFLILTAIIPAIFGAALPAAEAEAEPGLLEARACPSPSVISSCYNKECKPKGFPTDACYACCYNTCRPCFR